MNIPDYISPIVGHRIWQWNGSALVSLNEQLWPAGRALEAACAVQQLRGLGPQESQRANEICQRAPQSHCTCGIYAAKSPEHLVGLGLMSSVWAISGEVHLWGTIVEHRNGWRAQFAYPKSLVLSTWIIPHNVDQAGSLLTALTKYGADLFLADLPARETLTCLWTKRSGYHQKGLDAVRAVARCEIETLLVVVFAFNEERVRSLQSQVDAVRTAKVVLSHVGLPEKSAASIRKKFRQDRIGAVLVDMDSQCIEDAIRTIKGVQVMAQDAWVIAVCDFRNVYRSLSGAVEAGVDDLVDASNPQQIAAVLRRYALLGNAGVRPARRAGPSSPTRFAPPGWTPPPGGSTPPMAPVYAPWRGGPRPLRPMAVALPV
jgi:hypothetical protein